MRAGIEEDLDPGVPTSSKTTKSESSISSIDEINKLGEEEINEVENFISVIASKFECPEREIIIKNILSLGDDDEGQAP